MVSLVVATINRAYELDRLLSSLDKQTCKDFEVIVVDQNLDDRLLSVLRRYPRLLIRHLRCEMGVSKARNAGIRQAVGEILAFPDDDCWYPAELLAKATEWLASHPEFDVLLTATRNEYGKLMAPKFPPRRGPCTSKSILRCAVAFNAFLRARVVRTIGFFREDIGPGTSSPYQSGEDLDYLFRPLEQGFAVWYDPNLAVYHPDFNSPERLRRKMHPYALGQGFILRLHGYSLWCLGGFVARSLGGAVLNLCKGDSIRTGVYLRRAAGQLRGYVGSGNKVKYDARSAAAGSQHNSQ
jgi:glycosyltransferase involved in cell wall biosynthesis